MNPKVISIAASVLVVLFAIMLLMQKGSYMGQAEEKYNETTSKSYKASSKILGYVNSAVDQNRLIWGLATDVMQNAKNAKQQADLEAKYFPSIKGQMSIATKTRKFSATSDFYIVSSFDKVETDKKTDVKTLVGLTGVSVKALLGYAGADEEEIDEEEAVEEEVVEKAPAKAKKGKKGKKGKK